MSSVRQKRTEVHKTEARKEEALRHGIEPVEEKIEVVEEAVVEETPPAPEKPKTKKPAPKAKVKPAKKFK
tara:strand:+ start:1315 stop:1524 length:210 start_codon:yes stop_codon:yes gene_type:complete